MLNVPRNYLTGEAVLVGQEVLEVLEVLGIMVTMVETAILEKTQEPEQIPQQDSLI